MGKILQWNIQHFKPKNIHLLSLLAEEMPTAVCLTELHLNSNDNVRIRDYNFPPSESNNGTINSGIFVQESAPFKLLTLVPILI